MAGQQGTRQVQTLDPSLDRSLQTRSIDETLASLEECSAFQRMVSDADLSYLLRRSGLHTLFAPRNEALSEHIPPDPEKTLDQSLLPGAFETSDLRCCKSVKTDAGEMVPVVADNGTFRVGQASIIRSDIPCTNGVIHVTDGLVSG